MSRACVMVRGGDKVCLENPDLSKVKLGHFAYSLSHQTRFNGSWGPYSVAQHAVMACCLARGRGASLAEQMAALHHDDAEIVIGDIPTPVKNLCPDLLRLEDKLHRAVDRRWGVHTRSQLVREVDYDCLRYEVCRFLPYQLHSHFGVHGKGVSPTPTACFSGHQYVLIHNSLHLARLVEEGPDYVARHNLQT